MFVEYALKQVLHKFHPWKGDDIMSRDGRELLVRASSFLAEQVSAL